MVKKYIPKQGDIVFLDFNPTNIFNRHTKMVVVCPISSNNKEFPTHYQLEDSKKVFGSVLCEHVRSIDYEVRNLKFVEKTSDNDFISIITLLNACFEE